MLRHTLFDDNCFLSQNQPVRNLLVSESLLQSEGVKEGPKSRIGALYQGFEHQVPTFGYVGCSRQASKSRVILITHAGSNLAGLLGVPIHVDSQYTG